MASHDPEIEELWKNIGLEELRSALGRVDVSFRRFEKALAALPACNECAKTALLSEIETSGTELGGEVVGLLSLAGTLKAAVAAVEKTHAEFLQNCPEPCRCSGPTCTCHTP